MTDAFIAAEAFPPGEFLRDELEERGWTQDEFAKMIGRPARLISEILAGKRGITPETAIRFSAALGTSAQFWMNLETAYRLFELSRTAPAPESIGREARLRERFPVREMMKRGWIEESTDAVVLEAKVLQFYRISSVDEPRSLAFAASRSGPASPAQEAWVYRAKQVAEATVVATRFSPSLLRGALDRLSAMRSAPEEARHVPRMLTECGVRFVIVEPMRSSHIDGACFWLDDTSPVIAMTILHDRIDNFWFVLRHEIEHVLRGDGKTVVTIDTDLCSEQPGVAETDPAEIAANTAAAEFCVPSAEIENFLARVGQAVPEDRVLLFAQRIGVYPGLVVGQLHWRLQRYNFLRKYLAKVRDIVTSNAMTDGYGRQILTTG